MKEEGIGKWKRKRAVQPMKEENGALRNAPFFVQLSIRGCTSTSPSDDFQIKDICSLLAEPFVCAGYLAIYPVNSHLVSLGNIISF